MNTSAKIYDRRFRFDGALKYVLITSAVLVAGFGWVFGVLVAVDDNLDIGPRLIALCFLVIVMGTLIPFWLTRLNIRVKVDDAELSARLWPFRASVVSIAMVTGVELVTVDPLRQYGGWGIKGSAQDRLYGMSGIEGVRITHRVDGDTRNMTILTDDGQRLVDAIDG